MSRSIVIIGMNMHVYMRIIIKDHNRQHYCAFGFYNES